MIRTKKTFGEHIEDGLTFMGDGIYNAVKESKDHELEQIKLGLINDYDKLKMLKQELYRAAISRANPEHIANLRSAIATIGNLLEAERDRNNTPIQHVYGILYSAFVLGVFASILSVPATLLCNSHNSHSQACETARVIPTATQRFFSEPK